LIPGGNDAENLGAANDQCNGSTADRTNGQFATDTGQKIEPIKKVSDLGDELDFDITAPTTPITIEESEDWDQPDFSAINLDMEIDKFMTENFQPVIEEPPPVVYLSAARSQSSRECRINGICE
jgi:hypothetical protein